MLWKAMIAAEPPWEVRMPSLLLFTCAAMLLFSSQWAKAQEVAFTVTYIEATPSAKAEAAGLLKQYSDNTSLQAGLMRLDVLQRVDRTNHFAIVAVWKDGKAAETHASESQTKEFRSKLQPLLIGPYDERPHVGLSVGPATGATTSASGLYAVTHVDIIPPKKDDGLAAIKLLSEHSRKEPGTLRYEALQQNSRPNHVRLVEVWNSEEDLERHETAPHTREFRELLLPMSGSLYDQRLYRPL